MKVLRFISSIAIISGLASVTTPVFAQQAVTVDCGAGQSIQAAVDAYSGSAEHLDITVTGTCVEDVLITRDGVSLIGNNEATLVGRLFVRGANRIAVSDMNLTGGPVEGIRVGMGYFIANGITVSNYAGPGIWASGGGSAILIDSRVANNGGHGITAELGSNVRLNNTVVEGNGLTGIYVFGSSAADVRNSDVRNNNNEGIGVFLSSSLILDGSHLYNNEVGLHVFLNSSAFLDSGTTLQSNIVGIISKGHSIVDLENVDVSNNTYAGISLEQDGAATLRTGNTVAGNGVWGVLCADTECSFSNAGEPLADPVECTGFDQVARHPPKKGK